MCYLYAVIPIVLRVFSDLRDLIVLIQTTILILKKIPLHPFREGWGRQIMKKLFTFLLALVASVSTIYAQSGTCGDNLTWTLADSVLTISGMGAMENFAFNSYAPWYDYRSSIKSVIISDGVTSIGYEAFSRCSSLSSVTIGNSVTSIGKWAFSRCSSLTSVTIPNSVTSIGDLAFAECSSLTSVTIGNSVTSIGEGAFYGCKCTSITIPNSVTSIGEYAFFECSSLTSITIPNSVTTIGRRTFRNCSSLTSVTIGNSVTSIGESTFSNCSSLTSVSIGNGVTSIGADAFAYCDKLVDVYCYATTPPIVYDAYSFENYDAYLYIPCESKKAYMEDAVWRNFKYIECISSEGIEDVQSDEVQGTKVVKDGQVLILRNDKTYTMQGVEVK